MSARPSRPNLEAIRRWNQNVRDAPARHTITRLIDYALALEQDAVRAEHLLATPVQRYGPNLAGASWVMVDAEAWDGLCALLGAAS